MSKRIFWEDNRAVIIPIDHGLGGIIKGWEEPGKTLALVVAGQPDAVLTTFGNLKRYRSLLEGKVATMLRLDSGPSAYWSDGAQAPNDWRLLYSVEDAARLGASGVRITAWFDSPIEMQCLEMLGKVAADCYHHGLLLCVETFPVPGPKIRPEDVLKPQYVAAVCRRAYEYGADMIKTHFTGSVETFRQVTATCPIPILIAGGAKEENDWEFLSTVKKMLDGGGMGVLCGRNVFQDEDPGAMVRALVKVVHDGASVDDALAEFRGITADAFLRT